MIGVYAITDGAGTAIAAAFTAIGAVLTALIVYRSRGKGADEAAQRVDQKLRNGTGEFLAAQVMSALHPQLSEIRADLGHLHERQAVTERALTEIPKLTDKVADMADRLEELNRLHTEPAAPAVKRARAVKAAKAAKKGTS